MNAIQTTNSAVHPPQQDPGGLSKELWEHFYPRDFVATLFAYLKDHRTFFDEVFREQWERKLKPIPFFFASFSIVLLISLVFPSVNPFYIDEKATALSWVDIYNALDQDKRYEFIGAFGLEEASQEEDIALRTEALQMRLQQALDLQGIAVTGEHLQSYLQQNGHEALAMRIENMILKSKSENKVNEFISNEVMSTVLLSILLIYMWIVGKIFHRFLKVPHRTQKETIYVYLYNYSAFILLNIPAAFVNNKTFVRNMVENPLLMMIFALFFLTVSVYAFVKNLKVFRYTHNVGFGRFMWAGLKAGLVVLTLGVPLLFMSSSEKNRKEKASNRFQRVLIGIAIVVGIFVLLYWYGTTIEDGSESTESSGIVKTSAMLEEKFENGSEPVKPRESVKTNARLEEKIEDDSESMKPRERIQTNAMLEEKVEDDSEPMKPREGVQTSAIMLEEKILGIWYSEIQEIISEPEGTVSVRGTTEYLRNGTSTTVGEMALRAYTPEGEEFEIMYSFMVSGEWMLYEQKLVEKMVDMKTMPKYLEMNEERIDLQYLVPAQHAQLPKIEDMIPMGISEEYEIIEMGATVMKVKSRDSLGNEKIIVNYKRDKPFISE